MENYTEGGSLPDISIEFRVLPVLQKSSIARYPEAMKALKLIQYHVPEYKLDPSGLVCLFEFG